jgi:DnaK suppressor protein
VKRYIYNRGLCFKVDVDDFKKRLQDKERELTDELGRFKQNALDARTAEVEDPIDTVISSEAQATALHEATLTSDTLTAVRDALRRIDEGVFGICVDCGRSIEPARLRAVPWTPYCLADQELHDRSDAQAEDTLDAIS